MKQSSCNKQWDTERTKTTTTTHNKNPATEKLNKNLSEHKTRKKNKAENKKKYRKKLISNSNLLSTRRHAVKEDEIFNVNGKNLTVSIAFIGGAAAIYNELHEYEVCSVIYLLLCLSVYSLWKKE